MPNPFSNKPELGSERSVKITESVLACEFCFEETPDGIYFPKSKKLTWDCVSCQRANFVKDIDINV